MGHIDATYEGGALRPSAEVSLAEHQRVRLIVQAINNAGDRSRIERARDSHRKALLRHGPLPDHTPEIAEDRLRDA